ncbi:MATE family efflux transporter [Thaumasiovibrio sp. DFM-14]|uniref:MATE family efflux transporter n=1 Tax=Thaumasiovibrio sp. DFM-14 TaxID=3384792 RepID=UPI00399EF688
MQGHPEEINGDESVSKTFWRFAIPSIAAMVISGIYQVIDGIFVGIYIGFEGLAGINMAWPILGSIMGIGIMIGMGGGALMSIYRGERQREKVSRTLSSALGLIALFGLMSSFVLALSIDELLQLQGAKGEPLRLASEYLNIFIYAAVFTIASGALPMLVRNDNSPKVATALTIIGAVTNILLDYLLIGVFDMALKGAAIATVISQALILLLALGYFLSSMSTIKLTVYSIRIELLMKITSLGASSLFMFMYFSFITALHNKLFMLHGSAVHVGAFAIVGYMATIYYLFAEGLASGMQPPVSYFFGAKKYSKVEQTVKLAFKVIVVSGIGAVIILNAFPAQIIQVFAQGDNTLLEAAVQGVRLHLFALYLDGFIFLASVYFMAVGKGMYALLVSVGNILIQVPFLYLLPQWLSVEGVWLSVPLSNITLILVIAPLLCRDVIKMRKRSANSELILA